MSYRWCYYVNGKERSRKSVKLSTLTATEANEFEVAKKPLLVDGKSMFPLLKIGKGKE